MLIIKKVQLCLDIDTSPHCVIGNRSNETTKQYTYLCVYTYMMCDGNQKYG